MDGVGQYYGEGFVGLDDQVLQHLGLDDGAGLAGGEGEGPGGVNDVVAVQGVRLPNLVVHGHRPEGRQRAEHVHPEVYGGVALASRGAHVPESQHRQGVPVPHDDRCGGVGRVNGVAVARQDLDGESCVAVVAVPGFGEEQEVVVG